jgi:hypothetical protein
VWRGAIPAETICGATRNGGSQGENMLGCLSNIARGLAGPKSCLTIVLALTAGAATAARTGAIETTIFDVSVGDVRLQLTAPRGQTETAAELGPLYTLHDVSGDRVEALAVYLVPETARFFSDRDQSLPPAGLTSTLIVTDRELENRHVDEHAIRDVLADELKQQRELQSFLSSHRFGPDGLRVSLPEPRLLAVEDFLVLEAHERILPDSGRRISYCVEAFLRLRNRAVLASSCLAKPDVGRNDMYALENAVSAWARRLLADNPSSRLPTPKSRKGGAFQPTADVRLDEVSKAVAVTNLRSAVQHRRQDVLVASGLLRAQLPSSLRSELDKSSERFVRNVGTACGQAHDTALAYECELIAFDRRLRALEHSTQVSIAPALEGELVDPLAVQNLPNT